MIVQNSSVDMQKLIRKTRSGKISVSCKYKNPFIPRFLFCTVILSLLSLIYLDIDWIKLISRFPDIGGIKVFFSFA